MAGEVKDLRWSEAELEFQEEARAFLAENLPDELRHAGQRMISVYADQAA